MKHTINFWAFIFSFICVALFFLYLEVWSPKMNESIMNTIYFHPLFILLVLTLGTFFVGMIGFSKINNWKAMLRSIITVFLTFSLSVFLAIILFVGYGLS
ncbi:hypothetical protein COK00_22775 [Bacillus cereus]|uniref:Uncharacterized protein n=1 Tax=Bacillus cereus TaxID=1396 RepID=A0A2C1Y647_BACCE|nr:hypothetical protein [Bacillus cereus]PEC86576.1 hypothetical protein CON28_04795 [Bacillus cereus]PEX38506.1 hypothetical protein CN455_12125 [Bacillus cereus]PFB16444.1 hypothetical protein CN399_10330 [Bacillus cereus]PFB63004.1 hypothetical protein CN291_20200 [Bacillus cereus]PFC72679.1 hypothetical protein CN290_17915 [Bacillus cereus]